jgi:hypothetical protein
MKKMYLCIDHKALSTRFSGYSKPRCRRDIEITWGHTFSTNPRLHYFAETRLHVMQF